MKETWKYFLISVIIIIIDQVSKYLVRLKMPLYHSIEIFGNYFKLTHVENHGAAFSLSLGDHSRWIFIGLTLVLSSVFVFMIIKQSKFQKLYFSFILGGAIGNLIDRIVFGKVTDFLDSLYPRIPSDWNFFYSFDRWPTFNVADSMIVIGMILFAIDAIILDNKRKKSLEEA
jgi:signal peptidase II